jgi:hypothetical protein
LIFRVSAALVILIHIVVPRKQNWTGQRRFSAGAVPRLLNTLPKTMLTCILPLCSNIFFLLCGLPDLQAEPEWNSSELGQSYLSTAFGPEHGASRTIRCGDDRTA